MSPHPLDSSEADGVARQQLSPEPDAEADDWSDERMRAARPRSIRLNADGSRADPPHDQPHADAPEAPPAS